MCKEFSGLFTRSGTLITDDLSDAHEWLIAKAGLRDSGIEHFVRLEYTPRDKHYADLASYSLTLDEKETPVWFDAEARESARVLFAERIKGRIVSGSMEIAVGQCLILTGTASVRTASFCRLYLYDTAGATLCDNAQATLYGNAQATLYGNAQATLHDNAQARLSGNAQAWLSGNAQATLCKNARATLCENAQATLWDNAQARLSGNARATLHDNAQATLYENAQAIVYGIAEAKACTCGCFRGTIKKAQETIDGEV